MELSILEFGLISLLLWGSIWLFAIRRHPCWASPSALFILGVLVFYVIPPLYWQFREWQYRVPPYFEGLPLVLAGTIVLGAPFLFSPLLDGLRMLPQRAKNSSVSIKTIQPGARLWVFLIPIVIGVWWRLYMVSIGWQGRFERELPTLLGSQELAVLVANFAYYYPICYFALVGFGNRAQGRAGAVCWITDGLLRLYVLHRYEILIFVFRSLIFVTLLGWRIKRWQFVSGVVGSLLILALLPQVNFMASDRVASTGQTFLTVPEVLGLLYETGTKVLQGQLLSENDSKDSLVLLDDAVYRLYEARSASAVMASVPEVIPYQHGETITHLFYTFIPRYLWEDKPELGDIHRITIWVMHDDEGVNPTGTIAELYLNEGYFAVFLGGLVSLLLCRWGDRKLTMDQFSPALVCVYPFLAEIYIAANFNFTQRISEGLRALLVLVLVGMLFQLAGRRIRLSVKRITQDIPNSDAGISGVAR